MTIHGFGSWADQAEHLRRALPHRSFYQHRLAGHGYQDHRGQPDARRVPEGRDYRRYIDAVENDADAIGAKSLLGISLGATLSTHLMLRDPASIDQAVLCAPALRTRHHQRVGRMLEWLDGWTGGRVINPLLRLWRLPQPRQPRRPGHEQGMTAANASAVIRIGRQVERSLREIKRAGWPPNTPVPSVVVITTEMEALVDNRPTETLLAEVFDAPVYQFTRKAGVLHAMWHKLEAGNRSIAEDVIPDITARLLAGEAHQTVFAPLVDQGLVKRKR